MSGEVNEDVVRGLIVDSPLGRLLGFAVGSIARDRVRVRLPFREAVTMRFGAAIEMGRFHERAVGPHPQWSYQIAFAPSRFAEVVGWLALNHSSLDVFLHPNTDDELRDHRDCAIWIGRAYELDLRAVGG